MEEEITTLNEEVEAENDFDDSSSSEAQAEGEATTESDDSAEEYEEEVEETEESSKKGYSNRVRELNRRVKEAEAEKESLAEKLRSINEQPEFPDYPIIEDDQPLLSPGEEIDAFELDRRLRAREQNILLKASAMSDLKNRQFEAVNRIDKEAEEVVKRYKELDSTSEFFNPELSAAITEATEIYVKNNPYSASVKSFVDKMMRPYKGAVSKEVGNMTSSVAKQVSEAAVRPTSVRKEEKSAREKSIAELEAELGIIQA